MTSSKRIHCRLSNLYFISPWHFMSTNNTNIKWKPDLLEKLDLTGICLVFQHHSLQIISFSVKKHKLYHTLAQSLSLCGLDGSTSPLVLGFLVCIHILQLVQVWVKNGDVCLSFQQRQTQLLILLWGGLIGLSNVHVLQLQKWLVKVLPVTDRWFVCSAGPPPPANAWIQSPLGTGQKKLHHDFMKEQFQTFTLIS